VTLREAAVRVLANNWRARHTVPSASLYPHQWSWDSAFTAIGLADCAQHRAQLELQSLLNAQWADGRLPHIVFDPETPPDSYFPGPRFWRSEESPEAPGGLTSGLIQPPVHARAAWEIYRRAPDRGQAAAFLHRAYASLAAWHDYLYGARDLGGHGLAAIVHPWESGMDNSPAWDEPLGAHEWEAVVGTVRRDVGKVPDGQRPHDADYAAYIAVATHYRDRGYRDGRLADHLFAVEDPLVNAVLAWSEEALGRIAGVVGADAGRHYERAEATSRALVARLYDRQAGMFFARDLLHTGDLVRVWTVSGLTALVAPRLPRDVTGRVCGQVSGTRFGPLLRGDWLLPSHDRTDPAYESRRYWRGPAWTSTTWLVCRGLRRYGQVGLAAALSDGLLRTVARSGFREYYDPETGDGCGTTHFSWTAALVLDLLREPGQREPVMSYDETAVPPLTSARADTVHA
jgi:hypothetical protein